MGMIADELEHQLIAVHAMLNNHAAIMVSGAGLHTTMGGPVVGKATVDAHLLYAQLTEISKALKQVSATVKKLEDKIKLLENVNPATGRQLPPAGFRK